MVLSGSLDPFPKSNRKFRSDEDSKLIQNLVALGKSGNLGTHCTHFCSGDWG